MLFFFFFKQPFLQEVTVNLVLLRINTTEIDLQCQPVVVKQHGSLPQLVCKPVHLQHQVRTIHIRSTSASIHCVSKARRKRQKACSRKDSQLQTNLFTHSWFSPKKQFSPLLNSLETNISGTPRSISALPSVKIKGT